MKISHKGFIADAERKLKTADARLLVLERKAALLTAQITAIRTMKNGLEVLLAGVAGAKPPVSQPETAIPDLRRDDGPLTGESYYDMVLRKREAAGRNSV